MNNQKFFELVFHYINLHKLVLNSKFESIEQAYELSNNKDDHIAFLNECFHIEKIKETIDFKKLIPAFKKAFPAEDLKLNSSKEFVNDRTKTLFEGFTKFFEFKNENSLEMYWSNTYGWCFNNVDGNGVEHPEFENFEDKEKALKWATKNGYFVEEIDEED